MAYWFEDYFDDSNNLYVADRVVGNPLPRILENGLNENTYSTFTFWKLVKSKCGFNPSIDPHIKMKDIFDGVMDSSWGLVSLKNTLSSSSCNFGNHLGINKSSSLEAAIAYYSYATLFENEISLLDSNEINSAFSFEPTDYKFKPAFPNTMQNWLAYSGTEHQLDNIPSSIPPAGAFSFYVPSINGDLPDGIAANLHINSTQKLIVSIASKDTNFIGESNNIDTVPHTWFYTTDKDTYTYNSESTDTTKLNKVPKVFVTLVNPSLTNSVNVNKISFKIDARFTKLDANGKDLANDATSWTCVRDNEQKLIWEVKIQDDTWTDLEENPNGDIHDQYRFYRWGGYGAQDRPSPGDLDADFTHYYWDWNKLLLPSNQDSFCGLNNWRVPSRLELMYFNNGSNRPINVDYFPNASWGVFWSSDKTSYNKAWAYNFREGYPDILLRSRKSIRVKLVHDVP